MTGRRPLKTPEVIKALFADEPNTQSEIKNEPEEDKLSNDSSHNEFAISPSPRKKYHDQS
ncbi:hypothetical protein RND71_038407 [Anisodus tanguticus]|uniref:Uncharacterized protein n=1 Tax=Anisodus tanguticus TaxID=243964 RepID=A0AAE1QZZ9_9SOLA|nr:hypothetical protein RND71_038407 [Anisodus tanguticus]